MHCVCINRFHEFNFLTSSPVKSNTEEWWEAQLLRYLAVLLQVVVQDLRVGLLVRCQDVHEGGGGIAGRSRGVDGSCAPQRRRQAEGSRRRAGVETLLVKRLQRPSQSGRWEQRQLWIVSNNNNNRSCEQEKMHLPASLCKQILKYLALLCC